jgi:hypothetical protein
LVDESNKEVSRSSPAAAPENFASQGTKMGEMKNAKTTSVAMQEKIHLSVYPECLDQLIKLI